MADTVELSEFYDLIRPECPGVLKRSMNAAILRAAIDFCQRTKIWREHVKEYSVFDFTESLPLKTMAGQVVKNSTVVDVKGVALSGGTSLRRLSIDFINENLPGWRGDTATRPTGYLVRLKQKDLVLYPALEDDTDDIEVEIDLVLKPTFACTELPLFLYDDWVEDIAAGAKYRLQMQPRQEWTSLSASVKNRSEFAIGILEACRIVARQNIDARNALNRQKER